MGRHNRPAALDGGGECVGHGLIWGLVAAPTLAVLTVVVFFWLIPWLCDTPFLFAFPLAMIVGIAGFLGGFLTALLRQVREVLTLPLWCQVVHIVAVLLFGFMTVRLADLAIQTAQDSLAGRISWRRRRRGDVRGAGGGLAPASPSQPVCGLHPEASNH